MNRRQFIKTVGAAAVSLSMPHRSYAGPSNKKPNVILVMTDDQGYGDLRCHGNTAIETPNLDRLYNQSVRLTNFHVSPTCSPTRAALMTGRYCNRTGVWHTIMGRSLLRKDELTMADVFAANGYRTAIFGKWHLGDNYPYRPQDRGFQEVLIHSAGGIGQGADYWGNDYFDDTYRRNGRAEKFRGYCTDVWFAEAIKFIEANRNRPFFCYLPTNAAHGPFRVPDSYSRLYKDRGLESPAAEFYGMITNIDDNMGRLMRRLDELGLSDNTILIFMTDNGSTMGRRHGLFNAGMRDNKGSEYDGGHRVPCFIRWPAGRIKAPRDIGRITAHIDLLPTLIDLCGLGAFDSVRFDGRSLVPLLTGDARNWPDRIIITDSQRVDHPVKWRKSAVMTDRWRLVNARQLYDIQSDPGQQVDIAAKHPELVEKLRRAYEKWWQDVSERFDEYCHIVIGSDKADPVLLTSHDIHGQVVWNHEQVRKGKRADGFWAVEIARDGEYELALRRWPVELDRPITAAENDRGTGAKLHATHARLKVGCIDITRPVDKDASQVKFRVRLQAGKTRLQGWFINAFDNGGVFGAYYVLARRLS